VKRFLWITAASAMALVIGACSNATDSARVTEEYNAEDGLDLSTLTSLDDIFFSQRENISVEVGLAGANSLSIKAGESLPAGLSMNPSGLITGTADLVETDTTANFTIVSDSGVEVPLTWTIKAPRTLSFTANTNWTVPDESGYSANDKITLQVLMVGGGGGGGSRIGQIKGGGGGGGQMVEEAAQVTPGEVIAITVGAGGTAGQTVAENPVSLGVAGHTTSFGSYLSAVGGGGGASRYGSGPTPPGGNPGGGVGADGTGASGTSKHGKTSTYSYSGNPKTLGGGGASGVEGAVGGSGGGGNQSPNTGGGNGTPNTGGGGAGGHPGAGHAGGSGVVYVNY